MFKIAEKIVNNVKRKFLLQLIVMSIFFIFILYFSLNSVVKNQQKVIEKNTEVLKKVIGLIEKESKVSERNFVILQKLSSKIEDNSNEIEKLKKGN